MSRKPEQRRSTSVASTGSAAQPFYKGKAKYLEVSDARRLKALEDENRRLKKLLAEAELDEAMLKEIASKNGDVRCQARGCRAPSFRVFGERAAGVSDACDGSSLGSLSQHPI